MKNKSALRDHVFFVSMPFGALTWPSIGLSLLQAALRRDKVSSKIRYFSIDFAERIGEPLYSRLSRDGQPSIRDFVGEWIFSADLFETGEREEQAYVNEILRERRGWSDRSWTSPIPEPLIAEILEARAQVPSFLDACVKEIVRARPRIVGFTSIFQQNVASLALARRVRAALPETYIVFGGANCEGAMGAEIIRQFPFVDAVVSGEGDLVFPELVKRVFAGASLHIRGVRTRASIDAELAAHRFPSAVAVQNLDELPYPDYSDFFRQFARSSFTPEWQPGLFYETSRGCWWGEKMHCTFCGLNGETMAFRSKSASRALDELLHLTAKYPKCDVQIVDNILDMKYFADFIPELAKRKLGVALFYETKSNLRREQLRLLAHARVRDIQPGIESLSDSVLKLMRKGVTGLQNIQLLKWCKEMKVTPHWNFLFGFPGEDPHEYERMSDIAKLITHLQPPTGSSGIRLDRFSPNFDDAERMGFTAVRPLLPYRHVYHGVPDEALANLAYYFHFEYSRPQETSTYVAPLLGSVREWQSSYRTSELLFIPMDDGSGVVIDHRSANRDALYLLEPIERIVYEACDSVSDVRRIISALASAEIVASEENVREILDTMIRRGILLRDGERYLALAVNSDARKLPKRVLRRVASSAASVGRRRRGSIVVSAQRIRLSAPAQPTIPSKTKLPDGRIHTSFRLSADGDLVVSFSD